MTASAPPFANAAPPRLLHLQILRAIAASLVVLDHAIIALDHRNFDVHDFLNPGYLTGNIAVDAFFVLSGFIMVRQSANLFGSLRGALTFAWHRILRIVPMYWLATLAWRACLAHWRVPVPHTALQLLLSFAFIPNYLSTYGRDYPVLAQGWTLNYEMAFYFLFTIAILFRRRIGIPAVILATLAVAYGNFHSVLPALRGVTHLIHFYNQWFVALFAFGAIIGAVEIKLMHLPRPSLRASPALLLAALPVLFILRRDTLGALKLWHQVAYYSIIVTACCTFVTLQRPGRFNRVLILCGDASYSTYITHAWGLTIAMPVWLWLTDRLHIPPQNPAGFIILAILISNLVGLAAHFTVERPITRALRRIKFPPTPQSATQAP